MGRSSVTVNYEELSEPSVGAGAGLPRMILVPLRSLSTLAIDGKSRRSGREINKNGFSNEVAWILLFMTKESTEKVSPTYITSLVHLENGPGCFHIMVIA